MYSGKPIIHSVNTSNDLVQIAKAGVSIQPENPREIANKIIEISKMGNEILKKWGENGKKADPTAKKGIGDDGGYFYDPEYVKTVERCQTSHLPAPYAPTPMEQGINVYYTNLKYGEIDFAIIEDNFTRRNAHKSFIFL